MQQSCPNNYKTARKIWIEDSFTYCSNMCLFRILPTITSESNKRNTTASTSPCPILSFLHDYGIEDPVPSHKLPDSLHSVPSTFYHRILLWQAYHCTLGAFVGRLHQCARNYRESASLPCFELLDREHACWQESRHNPFSGRRVVRQQQHSVCIGVRLGRPTLLVFDWDKRIEHPPAWLQSIQSVDEAELDGQRAFLCHLFP
jgi:hypothetical protein